MRNVSMPWRSARPAAALPAGRPASKPRRRLWLAAGGLCLLLGTVGIVVPLLPTVDFYVMAAWCFGRGSHRWECWLLNHPRLGPLVRDWRADRPVPLKAKAWATLSMALGCLSTAQVLPARTAWIPALCCSGVAGYLWSRPTRRPRPPAWAARNAPVISTD